MKFRINFDLNDGLSMTTKNLARSLDLTRSHNVISVSESCTWSRSFTITAAKHFRSCSPCQLAPSLGPTVCGRPDSVACQPVVGQLCWCHPV